MDNTKHAEDCYWFIKKIQKTKKWYEFMGIKTCPKCNATVEVTEDEEE